MNARNPTSGPRACIVRCGNFARDPRVQKQTRALLERGWKVDVICLEDDQRADIEEHPLLTVHRVGARQGVREGPRAYVQQYVGFFLRAVGTIASLSRAARIDVVQVNNCPNFLVFAALPAKLRGAGVILDMQEPLPELFADRFGMERSTMYWRVLKLEERISSRMADRIITVSDIVRDIIGTRCRTSQPIVVVHNTPDESLFHRSSNEAAPPPFRIGCHSSLLPRYGIHVVIEAMTHLRHQAIRLDVYGEGSERRRLELLVRRLELEGIVRFHGAYPLHLLAGELNRVHMGVVPLLRSTFTDMMAPNKLFEYVALGKPVVASRLRGMQQYFDDEEVVFVEPGDPVGLARAIERLYGDGRMRQRLAERAYERYQRFRWDTVKSEYAACVESLREPV